VNVYEDLKLFQMGGVLKLSQHKYFLLLDEPGLGKTPQFIRATDKVGARRLLINCKAIAKQKWAREIADWGLIPRSVQIVEGRKDRISPSADATIINYDILPYYLGALSELHFDATAIDEAQGLAHPTTRRAQAIYGKKGIIHLCDRVWVLSGGLARNNAAELWTHLYTLFGNEMKTAGLPTGYWDFAERFCVVTPEGRILPTLTKDVGPLRDFLAARSLRRLTKDVLDQLPPRFQDVPLNVHKPLAAVMSEESGVDLSLFEGTAHTDEEIVEMLARGQHLGTFRRMCGLALVEPVAEMVKADFEEGIEKIVIFAHHREVIQRLSHQLSAFNPVILYGGMTPGAKQRAMYSYNNDPSVRAFIGQIEACGTSIDLPVGNEIIFAESSWVPEDNKQAFMRVDRPLAGQTRSVRARWPYIPGTIHEQITRALRRKTEALAQLYD
jgi:SNF2 family DNA or RNA helicase